jgi:hypothetical protein
MSAAQITIQAAESVVPRRGRIVGGSRIHARIAAALGLLSVVLIFAGFVVHGYPDIGATGSQIAHWAVATDPRQFAVGVYIEQIGWLLFLAFAAWLWSVVRAAERGDGWLAAAGFSAAVLYSAPIGNGVWWAVLDAGRRGTSPQTLVVVRDVAQHLFDLSLLLPAMFLLLTGAALVRTRALPRPLGAVALLIGAGFLIPPIANGIMGLGLFLWIVAVSLYVLVHPVTMVRASSTGAAPLATPAGS